MVVRMHLRLPLEVGVIITVVSIARSGSKLQVARLSTLARLVVGANLAILAGGAIHPFANMHFCSK